MEFLLNAYAAGKEELSQHLGMDAFISFTLFAQQVMNSQSVLDISRHTSTDEDVVDDDSDMSPERYSLEFAGEAAEDASAPSKEGLSPLLNMSHLEILQLLTQPIVDVDPAAAMVSSFPHLGLSRRRGRVPPLSMHTCRLTVWLWISWQGSRTPRSSRHYPSRIWHSLWRACARAV